MILKRKHYDANLYHLSVSNKYTHKVHIVVHIIVADIVHRVFGRFGMVNKDKDRNSLFRKQIGQDGDGIQMALYGAWAHL